MYGPRGVHGDGDYGTTGMVAVDFVGGDNLGSNIASNTVFAADTGTVDYVCDDGTSVAIRTHNTGTGDYFVYAHLLDNANLAIDTVFSQAEAIGNLKYGSFNDTCGWASQQASNYHLHFMFTPANDAFQIENCVIDVASAEWTCGNTTVTTGGFLYGGGGYGALIDDPGSPSNTVAATTARSFWDFVILGLANGVRAILMPILPTHNSPLSLLVPILNGIKTIFKLAYVLIKGNINLLPVVGLLLIIIPIEITMYTAYLIALGVRTLKLFWPLS